MFRLVSVCLAFLFATAASAQIQFPPDSRLKAITSTKTIRIAYRADARPFSFVNDKNEPVGFTIDLCRLVANSIGQQFGLGDLKIDWVPTTLQTRFTTVASGKADMECGSSTATLGRMKEVDFSNFVFVETTGIIVMKASNIRTFADMTGKKIAVAAGTTNEQAIINQLKQQKVEATLVSVKDGSEAVALLESGKADGFASDKLLLVGAHIKNPQDLMMLPDDLFRRALRDSSAARRLGAASRGQYGIGADLSRWPCHRRVQGVVRPRWAADESGPENHVWLGRDVGLIARSAFFAIGKVRS